jgi:STAM-binding protein
MTYESLDRYPYPSPVTTTSPPPGPINYPTLMSQHQMRQGYVPSLHSMFQGAPHENAPFSSSSLLFQDGQGSLGPLGPGGMAGLYRNLLPQQSMPANGYEQQTQRRQSPIPPAPAPEPNASAVDQTRITPAASGDVVPRELKTVYLPRESLPRFLNVAAVNTARNRETCGLLLGKDKKSKFVVTTLLIPKQHSTSDTCTMDEEELVMSFTEERSLITLGWVSIVVLLLGRTV